MVYLRYSLKVVYTNFIDVPSPIGTIRVFSNKGKITAVNIAVAKTKDLQSKEPVLIEAKKQIEEYFLGKRTKFDLPLDLSSGTEFQRSVWKEIAKIRFGKKLSYVDIAKAIDNPKASRAVGGAVGSNPIPLIVGCHRVLGATGKVTGYSGGKGIPTKRWLLKHEGITASDV